MEYKFENLDNFRDLGNIAAADGKRVAPGRLLRSGEVSHLTDEDIRILREVYHVVNLVDLRTASERLENPDCHMEGVKNVALDFFPGEAAKKADCSADNLNKMQSAAQQRENLKKSYTSFITDDSVRKALYEFLQLLLHTPNGATLFHCYAGKDRTGISAAVILTVLGVKKHDIMKDYLETNVLREEINEIIIDYLRNEGRPENVLDAVRAGLCVEQDYLETAYETAQKMYGSFENYILNGIGFAADDQERLRELYLI